MAVLLALGLGGYIFVYRPLNAVAGSVRSLTAPFLPYERSQNGRPDVAPRADVHLSPDQVRQFVRVRRAVRGAVGQDFAGLQNLYQKFADGQRPGTLQVLGAIREAGGFLGRAREAQRAALAREGMNEGEYADVRREVNRALGVPEFDLRAAARNLQSGQLPAWNEVVPPPNGRNARLIAPFKAELRTTAALGLLGL